MLLVNTILTLWPPNVLQLSKSGPRVLPLRKSGPQVKKGWEPLVYIIIIIIIIIIINIIGLNDRKSPMPLSV